MNAGLQKPPQGRRNFAYNCRRTISRTIRLPASRGNSHGGRPRRREVKSARVLYIKVYYGYTHDMYKALIKYTPHNHTYRYNTPKTRKSDDRVNRRDNDNPSSAWGFDDEAGNQLLDMVIVLSTSSARAGFYYTRIYAYIITARNSNRPMRLHYRLALRTGKGCPRRTTKKR